MLQGQVAQQQPDSGSGCSTFGIQHLNGSIIFNDIHILRELLLMIVHFQKNFTMRHIVTFNNQDLLNLFLNGLLNFNECAFTHQASSQAKKCLVIQEMSSMMNIVWSRVHFELDTMGNAEA